MLTPARLDEILTAPPHAIDREQFEMALEIQEARRLLRDIVLQKPPTPAALPPSPHAGTSLAEHEASVAIAAAVKSIGSFDRERQIRIIAALRAYFRTYGLDTAKPARPAESAAEPAKPEPWDDRS